MDKKKVAVFLFIVAILLSGLTAYQISARKFDFKFDPLDYISFDFGKQYAGDNGGGGGMTLKIEESEG